MESTEVATEKSEGQPERRMMFDESIISILRAATTEVFLKHGDTVRSIGVFIDYNGALNDADIQKGLWISPEGAVVTPAGVMGSAINCQRLLETILFRGVQVQENLQERLQVLLTELRQVHEELEELEQEKTTGTRTNGTGDPATDGTGGTGTPAT